MAQVIQPTPTARRPWVPLLVIALVVVALGVGMLYVLSPGFRGQVQSAVTPSCTVGLSGAAVSVTVQGADAQAQCNSFLGQTTDGGSWYVYSGGQQPAGASICQVNYHGDLMTVRDEGPLNLYGTSVCSYLTALANGQAAPTIMPVLPQLGGHAGEVIFTTDAPTTSSAASCDLGHQVTTVTAGTPVYANFFYKSVLTSQTVTLTIIKDGAILDTSALTPDQANGVDCVESNANLSDLSAGVYEFKLTTSSGEIVSDGMLTIR
jgi:hypothetical protein